MNLSNSKKAGSIIIILLMLSIQSGFTQPAREINCFRNFQETNDGDCKINAYLLSYITYLMYPERLARENGVTISETDNATFETEFKKKFEPMFWNGTDLSTKPVIRFRNFVQKNTLSIGLDPEAVVISTPKFIIVAFRGTDRVLSESEFVRMCGEWVGTDFRAPMATPGPGIMPGKVHQGFWKSIDLIRSDLDFDLAQNNPKKTKEIWITGHSLGAGQAELYAQYLLESGRIPADKIHCYMYAGPSFVGDQTFANRVNSIKTKFQRFEYGMDMVTVIAPGVATAVGPAVALILGDGCVISCVYRKSGMRNWYESATSYHPNFREREVFFGDSFTPNSPCEHNPNWYVRAIYNQLTTLEKSQVPAQAPSTNLAGCNADGSPVTLTSIVSNTLEPILWTAGSIVDNLVGGGDGQYKVVCHGFKNSTKKYLNWNGSINSQLTVSSSGSIFNLKHKLTGGYQLYIGGGNMAADVTYSFGLPTGTERTNNIIMKTKDDIIGDEETWYLFKVPNHTNTFVLYNWNTRKVLDAPNDCISGGGCGVNEFAAKDNEPTQVWILEKQ